jgi:predicted nucleic acid-binding protein
MKYLLDANILISLASEDHVFRPRAEEWIHSLKKSGDEVASCAVTELALVRILSQLPGLGIKVAEAKRLLEEMKARCPVAFHLIPDAMGADKLPAWVKTGRQTTDGHLAELAKANSAVLATLDGKIPGAFVIPESP